MAFSIGHTMNCCPMVFTAHSIPMWMSNKDVKITIESGVLSVSGAKLDNHYHLANSINHEFNHQQRSRSFVLPPDANDTTIQAHCKDGLLVMQIPKKGKAKYYRNVPVQGETSRHEWFTRFKNWWAKNIILATQKDKK